MSEKCQKANEKVKIEETKGIDGLSQSAGNSGDFNR